MFGANESGIFTNTAQVNSQDNANDPENSSASDTFHVLPVGQNDFGTTTVGVPVGVPILDNDHGRLLPSSVIITSQPANGTAAWNEATEQAIYTPNPGLEWYRHLHLPGLRRLRSAAQPDGHDQRHSEGPG